jgi:hypothetical protein
VTLEEFSCKKVDVEPCNEPTKVFESTIRFDVGLEMVTEFEADPLDIPKLGTLPLPVPQGALATVISPVLSVWTQRWPFPARAEFVKAFVTVAV